jgi:ATPase subunit of ABC transporter with duplicated ATPase domains
VGHVDLNAVTYTLPDGRVLLDDVSFRVGDGAKVALVGANGSGKTTLLRIIAGDVNPYGGAVTRSGGVGVMRQFVGRGASDIHDLLLSVAPPRVRLAAAALDTAELAMMDHDDEATQMAYAHALTEWTDAGGYKAEVLWDVCTTSALDLPYDQCRWRQLATLSGGEQKRLVLEALLRGPDEVLLLDEPDNFLDVPAKRWLEDRLVETPKTVLFVSHDRELLARTATRIVTLELGAAGTKSTPSSKPSCSCTRRRPPTTTGWPRDTRRLRPGCASSRRPALRRPFHGNRMSGCGCVVGAPGSARW